MLAIDPVSRPVWVAEVIPVVIVFLALLLGYRYFRFSHMAYASPTIRSASIPTPPRNGCCVAANLFALLLVMGIVAGYEIIEWWYAVLAGGDAGIEFLGSQGDIWDAQKDMLADTLGAVTALVLFAFTRPDLARRGRREHRPE